MAGDMLTSLSPKPNPEFVYFLLRSVAGSSFSSPNFPNRSSPNESALVFVNYLKFHFSVSQPKALRSRARGYQSAEPGALGSLNPLFVPFSFPLNFTRLPQTSPRALPLAQIKLPTTCHSTFPTLAWILPTHI